MKVWIGDQEAPAAGFVLEFKGCEKPLSSERSAEKAFAAVKLHKDSVRLRKLAKDDRSGSLLCKEGHVHFRARGDRMTLTVHAHTEASAPRMIRLLEAFALEVMPSHARLAELPAAAGDHGWIPYPPEGALFVRMLEKTQSKFQTIEVGEHPVFGRMLFLNGETQVATLDEALYSSTLVGQAMSKKAKRVCILGGGDCGVLREILTYEHVEEVVMAELDPAVVKVAVEHFPDVVGGAHEDPRGKIVYGDAFEFLRENGGWDVIVYDISDAPLGLGTAADVLGAISGALAPAGVAAVQCSSAHPRYAKALKETLKALRKQFATVQVEEEVIPSFLDQSWVFAFCRNKKQKKQKQKQKQKKKKKKKKAPKQESARDTDQSAMPR